jgi:hypothetical protein
VTAYSQDPSVSECDVVRVGRFADCTHDKVSWSIFGHRGVCVYCGAYLEPKEQSQQGVDSNDR